MNGLLKKITELEMIDLREEPNDPFDEDRSGVIVWLFIAVVIIAMAALNVAKYLMQS